MKQSRQQLVLNYTHLKTDCLFSMLFFSIHKMKEKSFQNLTFTIISTDEDSSLRIEGFATIHLRGFPTKLN